ncbi:unnamed protein product [Arctogadus glacialis]
MHPAQWPSCGLCRTHASQKGQRSRWHQKDAGYLEKTLKTRPSCEERLAEKRGETDHVNMGEEGQLVL